MVSSKFDTPRALCSQLILVPRAFDLLVSGWIVDPGNSRYAQCDKLLLRLLSIRKPETFCRRIVNTTIRIEG